MINYDDMTTEELKNLYNELVGVINERGKEELRKAMEKANKLITELNDMMKEYNFTLEVTDYHDCCSIETNEIIGIL